MSDNDITNAILRSQSHSEIAEIEVTDWQAALAKIESLAEDAGLECDHAEKSEAGRYDVWAYNLDAPEGEMVWRLDVRVPREWDFYDYWATVLGLHDPAAVVREFELDPSDRDGISEWLDVCESEVAAAVGGSAGFEGLSADSIPDSWGGFHEMARDLLCAVESDDDDDLDLVICESPDGWSLHAPGSTDEDIASGDAPYLLSGPRRGDDLRVVTADDEGTIDSIDGDQVTVRWDSGVTTTQRYDALIGGAL